MNVPVQQIGDVEIRLTNRCNAVCAHCGVCSQPSDQAVLPVEYAQRLLEEIFQRWGAPKYWKVSGGEPMLYPERAMETARLGVQFGAQARLVTNGFWATSPEVTEVTVTELAEAGIQHVWVSTDAFHLEFVPAQRIRNLIAALQQAEIRFYVNLCYLLPLEAQMGSTGLPTTHKEMPYDVETFQFHREIASLVEEGAHGWSRVLFLGRAKGLISALDPLGDQARKALDLLESKTPGATVTAEVEIREDGLVLLRDQGCHVADPGFGDFLDSFLPAGRAKAAASVVD